VERKTISESINCGTLVTVVFRTHCGYLLTWPYLTLPHSR